MELQFKTKKLTKLIIHNNYFLIKQKIGFFVRSEGPLQFDHYLQVPIIKAKAKDKFGSLNVTILDKYNLHVNILRNLKSNTFYTFDILILINPLKINIGGIMIINWGILDISQILSYIPVYQVLVYTKYHEFDNKIKYSSNLSKGLISHLKRFRNARIEIGNKVKVKINLSIYLDCTNCLIGSKIKELSIFGPIPTKNQHVKLLTKNFVVRKDKSGNTRYILQNLIVKNKITKIDLVWEVNKSKPTLLTKELGSIYLIENLKKKSKLIRKSLSGNKKNWNIWHPAIKKIVEKIKSNNIYDIHAYLFEFTNRRLHYKENKVRYPAIKALISKVGDCSEYADLLVTLHRAAGIPSQVVEGIILEADSSASNHSWTKFYTSDGWIPCDPTWGLELGSTSQHIEFGSQVFYDETKMIELKIEGNYPKINYKISWSEII